MKADEADAFSVGPEKKANSAGEAMISLPPKKRHSMALLPRKQEGQRECPLEASVKVKGEGKHAFGSTVSHKAHGKTLEKGHSPPEGSSSKRVPRKHKNAARGSAPPKPPNSLSDGSDGVSGAGLRRKPVGKLLGRRILGSDRSTRDRNGKARPALGVEPNLLPPIPEEIEDDRKHKLRKQVRRFGRKYEKIFQLLEEVEGEVRKELVEFTIKEAARFKRRDLTQHLEKMLEKFHIPLNDNN